MSTNTHLRARTSPLPLRLYGTIPHVRYAPYQERPYACTTRSLLAQHQPDCTPSSPGASAVIPPKASLYTHPPSCFPIRARFQTPPQCAGPPDCYLLWSYESHRKKLKPLFVELNMIPDLILTVRNESVPTPIYKGHQFRAKPPLSKTLGILSTCCSEYTSRFRLK